MAIYYRTRVDEEGKWLCEGPDPEPQPTSFEIPPGACDSHVHLFGPYDRFPLSPEREHTPPETLPADFFHLMDTLTLDRSVLVQPSAAGLDNRRIAEFLVANPQDLRGVAAVWPDIDDDTLRWLADSGFVAARMDGLVGGGVTIEAMEMIAEKIAPLNWHLEFAMDGRYLPFVRERLIALPVPVVLENFAHMPTMATLGHPGFMALWDLMRTGKVWIKLAGAYRISKAGHPYSDVNDYASAMIAAAPNRVVWGSDWPHAGHRGMIPNTGDLLEQLYDWAPDDALRERILVDNPAELYHFS